MNELFGTELEFKQLTLLSTLFDLTRETTRYKDELLVFISPDDLSDLGEALEEVDNDFFTEQTLKMQYNGEHIVFNVAPILKYKLDKFDLDKFHEYWQALDD